MKAVNRYLVSFFFSILYTEHILAFGEYKDADQYNISLVSIKKTSIDTSLDNIEKPLFVGSFFATYINIEPSYINPESRYSLDVMLWLERLYCDEKNFFKTSQHPMYWVSILKNNNPIGFAVFEQRGYPNAWHIRQLVIKKSEKRRGYGKALVNSINHLEGGVTTIACDIMKINKVARIFYRKVGFIEVEKPHKSELDHSKYLGLEWKKS